MDDDELIERIRNALGDAGTAINICGTWIGPASEALPARAANDPVWPSRRTRNRRGAAPINAQNIALFARNIHFPLAITI